MYLLILGFLKITDLYYKYHRTSGYLYSICLGC